MLKKIKELKDINYSKNVKYFICWKNTTLSLYFIYFKYVYFLKLLS